MCLMYNMQTNILVHEKCNTIRNYCVYIFVSIYVGIAEDIAFPVLVKQV